MRTLIKLWLIVSAVLLPGTAFAAVAYDTSAQIASTLTSSPQTVSITIGAANEWLICSVALPGGKTVSSFTYNGTGLTQLKTGTNTAGQRFYLYSLYNPSTGANDLTITPSGADNQNVACAAYSGGDSTLDSYTSNTYAGGVTTKTASTTVVASNSWFVGIANANRTSTASSGQTVRQSIDNNVITILADTNGTVSTGLNSMSWTSTAEPAGGAGTPMYGVSIAPVAAATQAKVPDLISWSWGGWTL